jgi:NADH:ubiquinone oxidoreductase subunit F (NADH-binding)/NADH:ubiquinone oxidoreductase subunit E
MKPSHRSQDAVHLEDAVSPEATLELLMEIQKENGSLTAETIKQAAKRLKLPAERVFGVASFYSMLDITEKQGDRKQTVKVCDGPVCWLSGGHELLHKLRHNTDSKIKIERTSCLGLCDHAPAALAGQEQAGPLTPENVAQSNTKWQRANKSYAQARPGELRVMLAKAGIINPDDIHSAILEGAYVGLAAALKRKPEEIIQEVSAAGLTGRGGAGFPVGRKWQFVAQAPKFPKYVICNADESEPLIFKDRVLIDTNPHQILEGMAIAGYATGAQEAYIYIRGEYEFQAQRLERAIQQAEEAGWLGERIQGTEFSFKIHVHRGAGAYICGEETALIESLEGKRGEPRNRPPYPPTAGFHQNPTLVNNVETYCSVPPILGHGSDWYRALSSYSTPGTKLYMVMGHVNNPGLFEAPFGLTLREVIDNFGGGMRHGSEFQFALTGGAAGTIVSTNAFDIPVDYASAGKGISLGAGAFLVCDQTVSPVAFMRELLFFFHYESCGKCTPCRLGTRRSLEILDRMSKNQGEPGDIEELLQLADVMQVASFCGLGQSVAIPVKSALNNFKDAFLKSIQVK